MKRLILFSINGIKWYFEKYQEWSSHLNSGQFSKQRQIFPYRNEKAKVRLKYPGTCTILSEHSTTSYTKSKLSINMQYYPGVHIANEVCISKKWGTTWISETNGISSRHSTNVVVHLTKFPWWCSISIWM